MIARRRRDAKSRTPIAWRCWTVCVLAGVACARGPERAPEARRTSADSLLAVGESLFVHEKYDSARVLYRAALDRARTARDRDLEARALTAISFAAYSLTDFEDARKNAEQSLALTQNGRPTQTLAKTYNVLGLVAWNQDRLIEAGRLLEQALEIARATNDSDVLARASGNLGLVAMNLGDLRRARDANREQRRLARALSNVQLEGNSFANEANVDVWEGNPRAAFPRLDTARTLYQRIGFARGQQFALSILSTAFENTGNVDAAFAVLDTALGLARQLNMKGQEAEVLRLLSEMHLDVGDYRRAVDYAERAERGLGTSGYEIQRAQALRLAADAYLRLGNLTRARANAETALRLDSTATQPLDQLDDLLLLAEIDYRLRGLPAAEPRLATALALADQIGTRGSRIAVAVAEAHIADASNNPRRVLRALRGAGPDIAAGDFAAAWQTNALEARAYARLNELDSAVAAGRRAIVAVERLRGALASDALRSTYVADRADVYSDLALALLRLGRDDEAFTVADAARSGELLRRLGAARDDARAGRLPRELVETDDLLRRIDQLVQRLRESERGRRRERGESADSADALLAQELERARGDYEALSIRVAQERPRAFAVLGTEATRTADVRKSLRAGEALLDYLVTPERLIVFVVTPAKLTVVQRELRQSVLSQRVRLLHDLWGSLASDWKWGLDAAKALDSDLISPVRDAGLLRGVRHVFIVPQGILAQVPFPALVDARTQRYLVQDLSVTVLPSAGVLPTLRRDAGSTSQWAGNGVALAPFPEELPATRGEVDAFRRLFPRASVRLGDQATEAELRAALALGTPVHVATHAVINARNPMFSRIELARPRDPQAADDGRLELHEVLGLSVRSPLVFLSGCETGAASEWTDDPVKGTAELTLAQAFLSAGAANVILTLWRIDDAGAGEFAKTFYAALSRLGIDDALSETQRRMATDSRYANPYYWAGYVLTGPGTQEAPGPSVSVVTGRLGRKAAPSASRP
jgi:CHAT domain-containing protein